MGQVGSQKGHVGGNDMNWKEWSVATLLMAGCVGGLSLLIGKLDFTAQIICSFVFVTIGADTVKAANEHITANRHK
jgi:hypothetical protein